MCVSVSWNMDKHANKSTDEINFLIGYFVSCFSPTFTQTSAKLFSSSSTSSSVRDLHSVGRWKRSLGDDYFPKVGRAGWSKGVMTALWCEDDWEKVPKTKWKARVSCRAESDRNCVNRAKSLRCLFIWGMNRAPRAPFYQAWGRLSQNDGSTRRMASKFNFPDAEWMLFFLVTKTGWSRNKCITDVNLSGWKD